MLQGKVILFGSMNESAQDNQSKEEYLYSKICETDVISLQTDFTVNMM